MPDQGAAAQSPFANVRTSFKEDPYQVAFAMAYLFVWGNYVYALVFGIIYQLFSLFQNRRRRLFAPSAIAPSSSADATSPPPPAVAAADAPLSPTPAKPASPPRPLRMPMATALWSWLYTAVIIVALGIFPYFLFLGPEKYIPGKFYRDPDSWWITYTRLYQEAFKKPLEDIGFIPFFFIFMVINREIIILICLALFVRWPKPVQAPVTLQLSPTNTGTMMSNASHKRRTLTSSIQVVGGVGYTPNDDDANPTSAAVSVGDTLSGPFQRYRQSTAFAAENLRERMAAAGGVTVEELNRKLSTKSGRSLATFRTQLSTRRDFDAAHQPEPEQTGDGDFDSVFENRLPSPKIVGAGDFEAVYERQTLAAEIDGLFSTILTPETEQRLSIIAPMGDYSAPIPSSDDLTPAGSPMRQRPPSRLDISRNAPSRRAEFVVGSDTSSEHRTSPSEGGRSTSSPARPGSAVSANDAPTEKDPCSPTPADDTVPSSPEINAIPPPAAALLPSTMTRSQSAGDLIVMRGRQAQLMRGASKLSRSPSTPPASSSDTRDNAATAHLANRPSDAAPPDTAKASLGPADPHEPIAPPPPLGFTGEQAAGNIEGGVSSPDMGWVVNRTFSSENVAAQIDPGWHFTSTAQATLKRQKSEIGRSSSLSDLAAWGQASAAIADVGGFSLGHKGMRHVIIIACHNSSEVLRSTLTHLLKLVQPRAVFLADNGSSADEVTATKAVAQEFTDMYRAAHPNYMGTGVNVGVLKKGSKTIAQFSVLNSLAHVKSEIEFVSLLDDDTTFPESWSEQHILNMFATDRNCHCLAYPIEAERGNSGCLLENFQNFEYRISMFIKIAQARIQSAFFPSGAVSTWRAATLLDILSRHDTMFRGDDLQMGLIMHTLYSEVKYLNPEEVHQGGYAIKVAPYSIPTLVPVHWIHLRDLFPKTQWKRLPSCACGEPSLFYQRARSWEVARHRFFWKFVNVCVHRQKLTHWPTWFAKLCAIDAVVGILNDFVQIAMVFYLIFVTQGFVTVGLLTLESLSFQMFAFHVLNAFVLNRSRRTAIPVEVRTLYPILYMLPINIIVKHAAMVYNYLHYTPMVRNEDDIGTQARKKMLQMMDVSWSPRNLQQEQLWLTERVAKRVKDIQRAKRFWAGNKSVANIEHPQWETNRLPASPVPAAKPTLLDLSIPRPTSQRSKMAAAKRMLAQKTLHYRLRNAEDEMPVPAIRPVTSTLHHLTKPHSHSGTLRNDNVAKPFETMLPHLRAGYSRPFAPRPGLILQSGVVSLINRGFLPHDADYSGLISLELGAGRNYSSVGTAHYPQPDSGWSVPVTANRVAEVHSPSAADVQAEHRVDRRHYGGKRVLTTSAVPAHWHYVHNAHNVVVLPPTELAPPRSIDVTKTPMHSAITITPDIDDGSGRQGSDCDMFQFEAQRAMTARLIAASRDGPLIAISQGSVSRHAPAFLQYRKLCGENWEAVDRIVKIFEEFTQDYAVPYVELISREVSILAAAPIKPRLTRSEILSCIANAADVQQLISTPGQRYRGRDGLNAAAAKIQGTFRMWIMRRIQFWHLDRVWAVGVFIKFWKVKVMRRDVQQQVRNQYLKVHLRRYHRLLVTLKEELGGVMAHKRIVIQLVPTKILTERNNMTHDYSVGRLHMLMDPLVETVFVMPSDDDYRREYYKTMLGKKQFTLRLAYSTEVFNALHTATSFPDHNPMDEVRVRFIFPEAASCFPDTAPLATKLICSRRALAELRSMCMGKSSVIIADVVGEAEVRLSSVLAIPLLGPTPEAYAAHLSTRGRARTFLRSCGVPTAPSLESCAINESEMNLHIVKAISMFSEVPLWTLRPDPFVTVVNGSEWEGPHAILGVLRYY
ncbi:hypothetical protein HDU86_005668 [Geranomyces michiganensis]|nr:hypothetical protein HDU86_005668 [Geranomyces michiganensis]